MNAADGTRSKRLGRRGFAPAIEYPSHPVDHVTDRPGRGGRARSSATILTCVLVMIAVAELTWIVVR